jgi:hypothetical protein
MNTASAGIITDAPRLSTVLLNALNFLLSIAGTLAIIGIVVSAVMYLTAGGSEKRIETAKKAFWYSAVGVIIAMGGYILIKTISFF